MAVKSRTLSMGVKDDVFRRCQNEVWLRVSEAKFAPVANDSLTRIAGLVTTLVSDTETKLAKSGDFHLSSTGQAWLKAEACVAWSAKYIVYDTNRRDAIVGGQKVPLNTWQAVLASSPPKGTCGGYSILTRDLARKIGLTCRILSGHLRPAKWKTGDVASTLGDHAWVEFVFPGDVHVPADPTISSGTDDLIKRADGKCVGFAALPRSNNEWEVFLGRHYNFPVLPKTTPLMGDSRECTPQLSITEDQWMNLSSDHLLQLQKDLQYGRKR